MNLEIKQTIWKAGFRPTERTAEFEDKLRAKLGLQNKYDSARLSIGRSLAEPSPPPPITRENKSNKAIPGEHLFGDEIDLWICVLVMEGGLGDSASADDFRALAEAHWDRGAKLLQDDFESCGGDEVKMISRLSSDFLPDGQSLTRDDSASTSGVSGEIRLKVGSVSKTYPDGESVDFVLNGPGTSPHIALMGMVGSGKTTTGIQIASQILEKAQVPLLFIDPKGEFVDDDRLMGRLAQIGGDIHPIEVGKHPIPLDFLPDAGVGNTSIQNAALRFRDSISLCCKGVGDIQQNMLRRAIEGVIRHERPRDLPAVRDWYKQELGKEGKKEDSIVSRLDELTALKCFEPKMQPEEFFGKSWILSLKTLGTEELKRLVILLVLDAMKSFTMEQTDSPVNNGHRKLRHLLVIDEARRILAQKKYESLVDVIRQGRSKGSVVMLLSQDPSDFDGQADDFTTQLGTVIAFRCTQSQRGLRAMGSVYGRKLQPAEFSDTSLPTGVAFTKIPNRQAEKIVCWASDEK